MIKIKKSLVIILLCIFGLSACKRDGTTVVLSEKSEKETEVKVKGFNEYDSMANITEKYGFKFGGAISNGDLSNKKMLELLKTHFNSITGTNEFKAYSLLDQASSKKNSNGMPEMNYTNADKIMEFAKENEIKVRGHVLVWDAYMCDWFFREGYNSGGAYVDSETMKARLKYYIETVINHFENKYPGVIYCWDVVNEAVADNMADYEIDDQRHLRKARDGKANQFYNVIGKEYVELSFLYAKDTILALIKENPDIDIKLFYNDYSTFYPGKREAIIALASSINNYAKDEGGNFRKLCDGIGMQGYIGGFGTQNGCMNKEDIARIVTAIKFFAQNNLEVHITEMAVRNYMGDKYTLEKHAEFYADLFEALKNINSESKILTSVSIWGLYDAPYLSTSDYAYKMNGPYCGLFTEMMIPKVAFEKVYEVLKQ